MCQRCQITSEGACKKEGGPLPGTQHLCAGRGPECELTLSELNYSLTRWFIQERQKDAAVLDVNYPSNTINTSYVKKVKCCRRMDSAQ